MAIPTSPGGLRSPRKRALEIGTAPAGFASGVPYDATAGVPASAAGGHYVELPPQVSQSGAPINTSTPFANLKK